MQKHAYALDLLSFFLKFFFPISVALELRRENKTCLERYNTGNFLFFFLLCFLTVNIHLYENGKKYFAAYFKEFIIFLKQDREDMHY